MKTLEAIDDLLLKVEGWTIVVILSFILLMVFIQVALRNILFTGFMWLDIVSRNMVLWIMLLGASIATKERKHIAIDVVSRFFSLRKRYIIEIIISTVSVYVCHLLAFASWTFLMDERRSGSVLIFNFPTWIFLIIIPFAFYVIAFRFVIRALKRIEILIKGAK